jgi:hypothetical protein
VINYRAWCTILAIHFASGDILRDGVYSLETVLGQMPSHGFTGSVL